jgi:hypothetical protein
MVAGEQVAYIGCAGDSIYGAARGTIITLSVVECFVTVCGVGLLEAPAHPLG